MTPEKQDKTLELSTHCSADSTPARNEVIMKINNIKAGQTHGPEQHQS